MKFVSPLTRAAYFYVADFFLSRLSERWLELTELLIARHRGIGWNGGVSFETAQIESVLGKNLNPVVVDVGALYGDWSSEIRIHYPSSTLVLIEPSPEAFEKLSSSIEDDNKTHLVKSALGASDGTSVLWGVKGHPGLTSLYERNLDEFSLSMEPIGQSVVRTLDSVLADLDIHRVDVIKVDTEGHDLAVLLGATNALGSASIVQFETGGASVDSRVFLREFFALLEPRGYAIHRLSQRGISAPLRYKESLERFQHQNFLAIRYQPENPMCEA